MDKGAWLNSMYVTEPAVGLKIWWISSNVVGIICPLVEIGLTSQSVPPPPSSADPVGTLEGVKSMISKFLEVRQAK